jgi:hypothetical protein
MADFNLPAATSVVDFLNTAGKDSSFTARKKDYATAGLDKRLGDFTGTSSQNLALLDFYKSQSAPTPAPAGGSAVGVLGLPKNTGMVNLAPVDFTKLNLAPPPTSPGGNPAGIDFSKIDVSPAAPPGKGGVIDVSTLKSAAPAAPASNTFDFSKVSGVQGTPDFSKLTVAPPAQPTAPATSAVQSIAPSAPAPAAAGAAPVVGNGAGAGTSITYQSVAPDATPSEQDLVTQFLDSEAGQALVDKQQRGDIDATEANEEAKRQLETKYASDKTTLENNLAKNGLAFSGVRASQVKGLADELAASELNVDRQLASKLLDADASLRDGILQGVADLAKKAADDDKEAISQLNAAGFAVVDGKLVPTLASRNADRAAQQQQVANDRADAAAKISEARLEIAQQSADLAEKRFEQQYGKGSGNLYNNVQALIDQAPDATEQDVRLAIRANPDVFGDPSEAQLTDALSLVGIPSARQNTIAINAVASSFQNPSIFSTFLTGDHTDTALADAKTKAKQALIDSKGIISYTDADGKTVTYKLNSDQLQSLISRVDTVTATEAKAAQ